MIGFLSGVAIGSIAGYVGKEKFVTNPQIASMQGKIDELCRENEKYIKRNKELERQTEDLLSELSKLRKRTKDSDESHDELEDELDRSKKELKSIRLQNEELTRKLKEYKSVCETQEAEISMLKEKLG